MADSRLIVALDVDTLPQVQGLVETLGDDVQFYKVGMQLFYGQGEAVVKTLKEQNKQIFLDLKLHDIPNTVAKATEQLIHLGANLMTYHACGGPSMLKAAAQAATETATKLGIPRPKLLAVTVLTSMSDEEWQILGNQSKISEQVLRLAKMAQEAGMDGVVASPQEAEAIRRLCGPDFLIVTPGIRPAGAAVQDQSRIATPAKAIKAGASYLVVGRPITQAPDCRQAARNILAEMREQA